MRETILVTGVHGLVGQYFLQLPELSKFNVVATSRGVCRVNELLKENMVYVDVDITDELRINEVIAQYQPAVVLHLAAAAQPDWCEENQTACWEINVKATEYLVKATDKVNGFFIYASTDFVFDGIGGPYTEEDEPNPVNYYGKSKLAGEEVVKSISKACAIVRTVLVYGNTIDGTRSNILTWAKNALVENRPIKVVGDQIRTPTYAGDLADGILKVAIQKAEGVWHISGKDTVSPFDIAIKVAHYLNLDTYLITKVDASIFTQPAVRPLKTGFNIQKAINELGYQPISLAEGIEEVLGKNVKKS
jgi:dTDP-4-dehydrorhamnose reductase